MFRIYSFFALLILPLTIASGQGLLEKLTDLMEFNVGRPSVDTNSFQAKVIVAPIAYYEPNTSLGLGVGANLLFKPRGAGPNTRTSNLPVTVSYTLNNQFFFSSGFTVFFPEEKWLLRGNLEFSDFPQGFYGTGNLTTEEDRIEIGYQKFLIEPLLLRQISPDLFMGGGFRYNRFYNTVLEEAVGDLPKGFNLQDSLGSTSSGLEFAATFDSRDNVVNASKGNFTEFTHGIYAKVLGGTHAFQLSKLDLRRYRKIGKKDILGFNFYGRYSWGDAPAQELSSLGGPRLLRGFQEGRFRDRLALFAQTEYRWQTWKRIGFVFYGGVGQVADGFDQLSFSDLYYSLGSGLRITIIPSENVNLRLDYAFGLGPTNDSGFYLGIGETF